MRFILCAFLFSSCGKPPTKANPCATKGATYFQHNVEANNGTCGPIPDSIINISADGTLPASDSSGGEPPVCEVVSQDGCTARDSGCKVTRNGITCIATTSVTFMSDGLSAAGLMSMNCSGNGTACASAYQITIARQ